MERRERRKHARIRIKCPLSFTGKDSSGNTIEEGMGIVRDVSKSGIQFETFQKIESKFIWLTFVDLEKNVITIRGEIVYSKKEETGQYRCGIRFHGVVQDYTKFAMEIVKFHHGPNKQS